jgi:hypothetical protein
VRDLFDPTAEQEVTEMYGVENGLVDPEESTEMPEDALDIPCPINEDTFHQLNDHIDTFGDDDVGVHVFEEVLSFVQEHL